MGLVSAGRGANSVDPEQMPHSAVSDMGLKFLLTVGLPVSRVLLSFRHHSERRFFLGIFTLRENILVFFISYPKTLNVFSVSVYCSQIFTLKLTAKN